MKTQQTITTKIKTKYPNHQHLKIINESDNHSGPPGRETHFKIIIVSNEFNNQPLLKRHREINECLKEELKNPIHALAIHAYTPQEWQKKQQAPDSPPCKKK